MSTLIHPTALISPKAELGHNVQVGPFSVIEDNVVIGNDSVIGSSTLIAWGARLGKEVKVHHGAVVSTHPQDLKFKGEPSEFHVGDRTIVREFCTLNRGTSETGLTSVGSDCLLMAYAHVAHDTKVGNKVIIANAVQIAGHVLIEDHVIIGGSTVVHQFCNVGAHAMIGGGFRIIKDVPPFALAAREPLIVEGMNLVGLRRRGFSRDIITALDKAYLILYRRGLNVSDALAVIEQEVEPIDEVKHLVAFIRSSKRGIIRGVK